MSEKTMEAPRIYPTFRFKDAAAMIDWLEKAFGFTLHARYGEGNQVDHAQMYLGSSMIMLGQARDDEYGGLVGGPGNQGGKAIYIAVDDADSACERARAAGARILEEPTDRDYGSREFICEDPEGNVWSFGTYWPKADEKPSHD